MKTRPWQTSWHLKQSEWVCLESRKQTWTSCLEKTPESALSSLTALWPERRSMCLREKWWREYILDCFFNSLSLVTVISQAAVKKKHPASQKPPNKPFIRSTQNLDTFFQFSLLMMKKSCVVFSVPWEWSFTNIKKATFLSL